MTFILAILGFFLATLKTRVLAILYCVFGLLTIILAIIVGIMQLNVYASSSPFADCIRSTMFFRDYDITGLLLAPISFFVLLLTSFFLCFSWAGSLFYICKPDENSVQQL